MGQRTFVNSHVRRSALDSVLEFSIRRRPPRPPQLPPRQPNSSFNGTASIIPKFARQRLTEILNRDSAHCRIITQMDSRHPYDHGAAASRLATAFMDRTLKSRPQIGLKRWTEMRTPHFAPSSSCAHATPQRHISLILPKPHFIKSGFRSPAVFMKSAEGKFRRDDYDFSKDSRQTTTPSQRNGLVPDSHSCFARGNPRHPACRSSCAC